MPKILPIVLHPHPALARKAQPVATLNPAVLTTLENMLETLYHADGVGLAAPQVDINQRLVVMDLGAEKPEGGRDHSIKKPRFFVNPEIIWASEETRPYQEGCLSLPGLWGDVERPASVKIRYTDRDGQTVEELAEGLFSVCIQHEIDHLDGIIFPQRMSRLRKDMTMKKWDKLRADHLKYGVEFATLTHDKGLLPVRERM